MTKRNFILFIATIALSFFAVLLTSNDIYAESYDACATGGGRLTVSSSLGYSFSDLGGGSDHGVAWVCRDASSRDTNHGILYFIDGVTWVSNNNGVYTIYPDIHLTGSSGQTPIIITGQVHRTGNMTRNNWAAQLGFCVSSSCSEGDQGYVSGIGNILSGAPSSVQRIGGNVKTAEKRGYWSQPYVCGAHWDKSCWASSGGDLGTSAVNAYINNANLIAAVQQNKVEYRKSGSNYVVKLYDHHQWYPGGSANVSWVEILVKDMPVDWSTNFDGKIDAGVTGLSKGSDGKYHTTSSSVTATFNSQLKRTDGTGNSSVSTSWRTDSGGSGNKSLGKNSGWESVKNYSKTVNLGEGEEKTVCDKLYWDGTVSMNGTHSNAKNKQACVTIKRADVIYTQSFDAKIDASVSGLSKASDGIYYTDSASVTAVFKHYVKRTDNQGAANVSTNWQEWDNKAKSSVTNASSPSPTSSGSKSLGKQSDWALVKDHQPTISLTPGQKLLIAIRLVGIRLILIKTARIL